MEQHALIILWDWSSYTLIKTLIYRYWLTLIVMKSQQSRPLLECCQHSNGYQKLPHKRRVSTCGIFWLLIFLWLNNLLNIQTEEYPTNSLWSILSEHSKHFLWVETSPHPASIINVSNYIRQKESFKTSHSPKMAPKNLQIVTMKQELHKQTFWRDNFAEFVMTFMLMSVQAALPLTWDSTPSWGSPVQVGLGVGFVVVAIGWALGDFGGGHINPAVSIAMMVCGKITPLRGKH